MAWTRNIYDQCTYRKDLTQSTSQLDWVLDPNKFYNCNECRVELGLYGGNNVSRSNANLVDVESELFNITRQFSRCPERKYIPTCDNCEPNQNDGYPCGSESCRRYGNEFVKSSHLPSCNIIQYAPRIDHTGQRLDFPGCASMPTTSADGLPMQNPPQFNPVQWQGQQGVCQN